MLTQYQNPVRNVKLKITRSWKWAQSFERDQSINAGRPRIFSLTETWILLTNSNFQSRNTKITGFGNRV